MNFQTRLNPRLGGVTIKLNYLLRQFGDQFLVLSADAGHIFIVIVTPTARRMGNRHTHTHTHTLFLSVSLRISTSYFDAQGGHHYPMGLNRLHVVKLFSEY